MLVKMKLKPSSVIFHKENHTYEIIDRKEILISTTQLMQLMNLSPSYEGIDPDVLKRKADFGTLVHEEIENYLTNDELGFTTEFYQFKEFVEKSKREYIACEYLVANDIVAGQIDLIAKISDKEVQLEDNKTTATKHLDAWIWQLSIYRYLFKKQNEMYEVSDTAIINWFSKDGLQRIEIKLKSYEEVERLIECYKNGEKFEISPILDDFQIQVLNSAQEIIKKANEDIKQAEAQMEEIKAAMIKAMQEQAITSFETDTLKITYVAPTTRTSIDSTKLKKEMPEIAEKYSKTSNVKASVRITVKE